MIQVREVYTTEPSAAELFFSSPTNVLLLGILVVAVIGLAVFLKKNGDKRGQGHGQ